MRALLLASLLIAAAPSLAAPSGLSREGERWLSHVKVLADDKMEGRLTGTPGYDRAAAYVADQFRKLRLTPAGNDGFLQLVPLKEQSIDLAASHLALVDASGERALKMAEEVLLSARVPQLADIDAPLVFAGYGLHLPEAGHDDFAGLDLKGKVVVILPGGPRALSGALKAHARSAELWPALQKAGAVGVITLPNPSSMDVPWERQKLFAATPGMRFADPALNDARQRYLTATINPAVADLLFEGTGKSFAELVALADQGALLPRFELKRRVVGHVAASDHELTAPNVVALLPGSDPKLKAEIVVLTAHLDHIGVGNPVDGDAIYNGAMDNASGIASMLEAARTLKAKKPKRSVLFVAVTGEERGLLGSRYFANRPSVDPTGFVANINMDMFLPLWPFTHVTALGAEDSSLGPISADVAQSFGARQVPDAQPDRNLFVRSDQYSFVRTGVPALALKFAAISPEERQIEKEWLTKRYHAPSDDLNQPINPAYAAAFNRYLGKLILTVANLPARPTWNADSFFARFAPKGAVAPAAAH